MSSCPRADVAESCEESIEELRAFGLHDAFLLFCLIYFKRGVMSFFPVCLCGKPQKCRTARGHRSGGHLMWNRDRKWSRVQRSIVSMRTAVSGCAGNGSVA